MPAEELTLNELSKHLSDNGLANSVRGDGSLRITGCNTIENAKEGEVTFLANPRYRSMVAACKAAAIIMREEDMAALKPPMPQIICSDPYQALTMAVVHIHGFREHPTWGVDERAAVSKTARIGAEANIAAGVTVSDGVVIGDKVTLYPGVFVGPNSVLGDEVTLYPNVVIYDGCRLGSRVTVHAGTCIGQDGLGYAPVGKKWLKIPQAGQVVIEDDVEIGSNCTIDRATLGVTRIGDGTKFSNLIAVGHGCEIGADCMLVAQVGIAGSVKVGRHVTIAGQAGIVGHVNIGDDASIGAKAGVAKSVPAGQTMLGQPAVELAESKKQMIAMQRLPEMRRRMRDLEHELADLKRRLDEAAASTSG